MKAEHNAVCQWIGADAQTFTPTCSHSSVAGKSYCADHVWRVYQEGTSVKPRKRAERQRLSLQDLIDDFTAAADELAAEGEL